MKKNEARRVAGFRQETVKLPAVKIVLIYIYIMYLRGQTAVEFSILELELHI